MKVAPPGNVLTDSELGPLVGRADAIGGFELVLAAVLHGNVLDVKGVKLPLLILLDTG